MLGYIYKLGKIGWYIINKIELNCVLFFLEFIR